MLLHHILLLTKVTCLQHLI
jgi:hypothetical protein